MGSQQRHRKRGPSTAEEIKEEFTFNAAKKRAGQRQGQRKMWDRGLLLQRRQSGHKERAETIRRLAGAGQHNAFSIRNR